MQDGKRVRALPIVLRDAGKNVHIGITRKGQTVYVQLPTGQTYKCEYRNVRLARAAQEGFRARLRTGWVGTLEELLAAVHVEVEGLGAAHERRLQLEREIEEQERKLASLRSELGKSAQ